jgi:type VI secretion system secreted protein VgrG
VSGLKSNSTPGGGGDNTIMLDDTKGKEKITIHGQYDMNTTVDHDQTNTVQNDFTETIKNNAKIEITEGTYKHDVKAGKADYHVMGVLTENYENTQTTTVTKKITIESKTAEVHVISAKEIMLHTVGSKLVMKQDGTITLTGKDITIIGDSKISLSAPNIDISGTKEVKAGVGMQSVTCDTTKLATSGANISQSAVGNHEITGAIVKIN